MASQELITKIVLKGMTDPSLTKAFKNVNKLSDSGISNLQKAGQTVGKIAKAGAVAVGAGMAASAKAAIDYESAFAGVMKTVDETGTTTYEDLSNGIRNLAKEMPASAAEIAGVAEAAGQLGIKADDIMGFTRTMINLGETTNLSSEEAATAIAKLFNVTGTSMDYVDEFGATLVALGNNAATTEADIMNMASRIAGSGNQIGLTEQQILALSTTLSSVGIEAEMGGSAISKVMTTIDTDVAKNSETLTTWAQTAGVSVGEFKKMWESDAYGALQAVIGGMGDVTQSGGNLNLVLEELGITELRTSDTMKRLSSASEMMGDMTNIANTAWKENTALTDEAGKRYATMRSQIQILKNKLVDMGITIGNRLMPHMQNLMDKINQIDFNAVADKIGNAVDWIAEHSTTIIAVIGAIGGAMAGIKIAGIVKGIITVVKVIKTMSATFGIAKVALAAVGGPVTLVVAAIGALIGIFVALWVKCKPFKEFFTKTIPNAFKTAKTAIVNFINNAKTFFVNLWSSITTACSNGVKAIVNFFTVTIPNAFNKFITFVSQLPGKIWNFLVNIVTKIAQFRTMLLQKAIEIGSNFVNAVVNFFQQLPYKIGYVIGFVIGKIILFGQKLWNFATVTVPQFIVKVATWFAQLPGKIWTWLTNTIQKIIAWGARMISIGVQKATQFVTAVVNFIRTLPGKIWTWLTNTVQKVTAWGAKMLSIGRQKATQFVNAVVNFFKTLPGKIWTWLTNAASKVVSWGAQLASKGRAAAQKLLTSIVNKAKEIPGKLLSIGRDIVEGLWRGISGAAGWLAGKVKSFAKGIIDGIKGALGINSPSVVMAKLAQWIPKGVGVGIAKNAKYAVNAVKGMGSQLVSSASKYAPTITTTANMVGSKLKAVAESNPYPTSTAGGGGGYSGGTPQSGGYQKGSVAKTVATKAGNVVGGNNYTINFAPVVHGGNTEEIKQMLEEEKIKFKDMIDDYFAEKERLAF